MYLSIYRSVCLSTSDLSYAYMYLSICRTVCLSIYEINCHINTHLHPETGNPKSHPATACLALNRKTPHQVNKHLFNIGTASPPPSPTRLPLRAAEELALFRLLPHAAAVAGLRAAAVASSRAAAVASVHAAARRLSDHGGGGAGLACPGKSVKFVGRSSIDLLYIHDVYDR